MVKQATLKYFLIIYLSEENRPCALPYIYKAISKKLKKKCDSSFKAHIRGILNLSIAKRERIFKRIPGVDKGVYIIDNEKTKFEKYISSITSDKATIKYFIAMYLGETNMPRSLSDIYKVVCEKTKRNLSKSFMAQIRGRLNESIVKGEGLFKRVSSSTEGIYVVDEQETNFEKYLNSVTPMGVTEEKSGVVTVDDALKIYKNHTEYAYSCANKMYGGKCIVGLDELQSASHIGLYKAALSFAPHKAINSNGSPIPFLSRSIKGSMLNAIREQKLWNKRNTRIHENDNNSLNVADIEEVADDNGDFTNDISVSELRDLLLKEMQEHLNDSEFQILSMRWGLDGKGEKTFKKVGSSMREKKHKEYNIDSAKSWSWQIERKARIKLSKRSRVLKKLWDYSYA